MPTPPAPIPTASRAFWFIAALGVFGFVALGCAAVFVALSGEGGTAWLMLAAAGLLLAYGVPASAYYRGQEVAAAGIQTDPSARAVISLVPTLMAAVMLPFLPLLWPLAGLAACYGVWAIGQTAPWTFGKEPAPGVRRSGTV
jgi:hypothetical protein